MTKHATHVEPLTSEQLEKLNSYGLEHLAHGNDKCVMGGTWEDSWAKCSSVRR